MALSVNIDATFSNQYSIVWLNVYLRCA